MGFAEAQIYDKISDITISMKALDYLDMPELITTRYPVKMTDKETKVYKSMSRDMVLSYLEDDDITASSAASLSQKLCQMANGVVYSDNKDTVAFHNQKLDALEDIVEAANGEPLLLAYWFKHDYDRIVERLEKLKVNFKTLKEESDIRDWNDGKITVGLIHPASNGHGLNLQKGGHHLVWFSLPWSLELYQQTNARLWRQGQSSKTVVIQHIVTEGTIDEDILKALADKDDVQERLIEAVKVQVGGYL